jgi:hypothetical protein
MAAQADSAGIEEAFDNGAVMDHNVPDSLPQDRLPFLSFSQVNDVVPHGGAQDHLCRRLVTAKLSEHAQIAADVPPTCENRLFDEDKSRLPV